MRSLKRLFRRKGGEEGEALSLFRGEIPKTIEEATERYPHLRGYLEKLEVKPRYVVNLDLELSVGEETNVLYPLKNSIFVHVKTGEEIGRYNIIEPPKPELNVLDRVESAVAKIVDEKTLGLEDVDAKENLEKLVSLFKLAKRKKLVKLKTENEDSALYYFLREKVGYGFLDGFLADPFLEDISIPGAGNVFVYHKLFGSLETNVNISKDEIDRMLRSIAERYGKMLSYSNPIIDIHLPDGSRFNVVFGEDISLKGSNFTIRKFPKEPISVAHLIKWNTLSAELAAYLWMLLEVGVSCIICGETASGKTTTLNALMAFIKPNFKIVSIEETPEVNLFHKNWVREVTRIHAGSPVTMFDLLKAALRQRPDYIIVGEIRGEEGRIAFQAIGTGHPIISTMHAGNLQQLFQRLTSDPISVPKSHVSALNLAIFQARMERGNKLIRRVTSTNELINYDLDEERLNYLPTFMYDPDMDAHNFMKMSFLLESIVLPFRGWGKERLPDLYREVEIRKEILSYLAEKHPRYVDVWRTIIEVDRRGVNEVYSMIRRGETPWIDQGT